MIYTVLWTRNAEQKLAAIWLAASDRAAVTAAAHRIDQLLRNDPDQQGESRDQGRRVLVDPPLGVMFRVQPDDRQVYVLSVWRIDKRSKKP